MSDLSESCHLFRQFDSCPNSFKKIIPFFRNGAFESMDKLIITDKVGRFRIKNIKYQIGFTVSNVNLQIFDNLFKLIQGD